MLEFKAAGYRTERRETDSTSDQELTVAMERERPAPHPPRHHPHHAGGSTVTASPDGDEPSDDTTPPRKKTPGAITDL